MFELPILTLENAFYCLPSLSHIINWKLKEITTVGFCISNFLFYSHWWNCFTLSGRMLGCQHRECTRLSSQNTKSWSWCSKAWASHGLCLLEAGNWPASLPTYFAFASWIPWEELGTSNFFKDLCIPHFPFFWFTVILCSIWPWNSLVLWS